MIVIPKLCLTCRFFAFGMHGGMHIVGMQLSEELDYSSSLPSLVLAEWERNCEQF